MVIQAFEQMSSNMEPNAISHPPYTLYTTSEATYMQKSWYTVVLRFLKNIYISWKPVEQLPVSVFDYIFFSPLSNPRFMEMQRPYATYTVLTPKRQWLSECYGITPGQSTRKPAQSVFVTLGTTMDVKESEEWRATLVNGVKSFRVGPLHNNGSFITGILRKVQCKHQMGRRGNESIKNKTNRIIITAMSFDL